MFLTIAGAVFSVSPPDFKTFFATSVADMVDERVQVVQMMLAKLATKV